MYRTGDKLDAPKAARNGPADGDGTSERQDESEDFLALFDRTLTLDDRPSGECCRFCGATLDYRGSKTLFATEYSRLVSSRINAACSHEDILLKSKQMELDAERAVNGEDDQGEERVLMKQLCHGCRNIFEDLN